MIELSSFYKSKVVIALIALLLTLSAVFYPAQARDATVAFKVPPTHSLQAEGFAWEIYVYPTQGQIASAKYMWLVDADGEEITGTRYSYNINCIKRGVNLAQGRDVFVDGNVIKFTGAFLRCDEEVAADFAHFQAQVSDWDVALCDGNVCAVAAEGLFVETYVKPYEQGKPGKLLDYSLFDNRDFVVEIGHDQFGWRMPLTDEFGIPIFISSPAYTEYDWGDQIKRLYMEKRCNNSQKNNTNLFDEPCTIYSSVNNGSFEEQEDQGYPTSYTYALEANHFFVGRGGGDSGRFLGELELLRFDPNSCGGCMH